MPYETIQLAEAGTDREKLLSIKRELYNKLTCQVIDMVEIVSITNYSMTIECTCQRLMFLSFPDELELNESGIEVQFKGPLTVTSNMIPHCLDVGDDNSVLFHLGSKDEISLRLHLIRGSASQHAKFCRFVCLQQPDNSFQLDVMRGVYRDVLKSITTTTNSVTGSSDSAITRGDTYCTVPTNTEPVTG